MAIAGDPTWLPSHLFSLPLKKADTRRSSCGVAATTHHRGEAEFVSAGGARNSPGVERTGTQLCRVVLISGLIEPFTKVWQAE